MQPGLLRAFLAALLAGLAMLCSFTNAAVVTRAADGFPDPNIDPFYKVPSDIGRYANGQVINSRPVKTQVLSADIDSSFQLLYKTTDAQDQPDATVATIWVPKKPASPTKVFSLQIFEDASQFNCNPSWAWVDKSDSNNKIPASLDSPIFVAWALAQGYYVVSPDHEGTKAAFIVGKTQGQAVLDGIRALKNYRSLPADSGVGFFGYSGGGSATVWATNLQPVYAPEINVVGSAHGGTPIDTKATFQYLNGGFFSGFAGAGLVGVMNAYPELNDYVLANVNDKGREAVTKYRSSNYCLANVVAGYPFTNFYNFITVSDPLNQPVPAKVLAKETLLQSKASYTVPVPKFPRYIFHGLVDEVIPYGVVKDFVKEQCAKGANIAFSTFALGGHLSTEVTGIPTAISWLKSAFDGTLKQPKCGTDYNFFVSLFSKDADNVMGKDLADQARGIVGKDTPFGKATTVPN